MKDLAWRKEELCATTKTQDSQINNGVYIYIIYAYIIYIYIYSVENIYALIENIAPSGG